MSNKLLLVGLILYIGFIHDGGNTGGNILHIEEVKVIQAQLYSEMNGIETSRYNNHDFLQTVISYDWSYRNFTHCPLWFIQGNHTCYCSPNINRQVICSIKLWIIYVMVGYCMTWSESKQIPVLAKCPYHYIDYSKNKAGYFPVKPELEGENLTHHMCHHFNRKGELCNSCKDGYGPAPFSNGMMCGKCKNRYAWLYYLLCQLILLTVMFSLCALFMVQLTKSPFNVLVFYWQIFTVSLNFDAVLYGYLASYIKKHFTQAVISFYAIWNLDFL